MTCEARSSAAPGLSSRIWRRRMPELRIWMPMSKSSSTQGLTLPTCRWAVGAQVHHQPPGKTPPTPRNRAGGSSYNRCSLLGILPSLASGWVAASGPATTGPAGCKRVMACGASPRHLEDPLPGCRPGSPHRPVPVPLRNRDGGRPFWPRDWFDQPDQDRSGQRGKPVIADHERQQDQQHTLSKHRGPDHKTWKNGTFITTLLQPVSRIQCISMVSYGTFYHIAVLFDDSRLLAAQTGKRGHIT